MTKRIEQINQLKQDIEKLREINKNQFNFIYEDNQNLNSYTRKNNIPSNTNTIYSINNNPIIYQKIVNTSFNATNPVSNKNIPLSLLLEYQKGMAHSTKANTGFINSGRRHGRNNPLNNYLTGSNTVNKSSELFKAPFKPGIFSYKKRGDFSQDYAHNQALNPSSRTKNGSKFNSSILSQDLKINFLDEGDSISIHDSNMKGISGSNNGNSSLINLNKYKIGNIGQNFQNDQANIKINSLPLRSMHRNLSMPEGLVGTGGGSNEISQMKNFSNNNLKSLNQYKINDNAKSEIIELSPIGMSPSFENKNQNKLYSQNLGNSNNNLSQPQYTIIKENLSFYKTKPTNEKESRRLMVEYAKVLKQLYPKTTKISHILASNGMSNKILQQEQVAQSLPQNLIQNNNSKPPSSNFFSGSQSPNCFLFSPKPEITPNPISLNPKGANMSMCSNLTDGTKQLSLFLSEINDESKEKINLINFLSIPRVMNLITKKKERQAYIFLLSPNTSSYVYGIESYAFRWIELKEGKLFGNFDMIKMISCLPCKDSYERFEITVDGNNEDERSYIIEASTREMCDNYIKCLNYLAQLIKCKIYHKNVNFSSYLKKS